MRTALDTNVLSGLLSKDPNTADIVVSLGRCRQQGTILISPVVYAELLAYPNATEVFLQRFLGITGIEVSYTVDRAVWDESGRRFARYAQQRRKSSKDSPRRLLADFLVGSHALAISDQLMTFDQKFYKQYFPELRLL
jgi:predicted nucleic acid-binding protein